MSNGIPGWPETPTVTEWTGVDARRFAQEIQPRHEPAILRGLAADWPVVRAARESRESLVAYLRGFDSGAPVDFFEAAPEIGGRLGYTDDLLGFNFERRQLDLAAFLDAVLAQADEPAPVSLYAGAIRIPIATPGLLEHNHHALLNPQIEQLASLWIGNRVQTAAHFDLPQNIAVAVAGRRRFTLFPIDQLPNLYVGPLDRTPAGQAISLVDFHRPDFERFPRFREAQRHARIATLEPGDALYLPSLWWHHVETLDPFGVLMNFWWREAPAFMFTPMITLMHSLLSIRDLPDDERAAWRTVFDHYIFRVNGDPLEHLPAEARGILGELTPEKVARLRHYLAKSLTGRE